MTEEQCNIDLKEGEIKNENCDIWKTRDERAKARIICIKHNRLKTFSGECQPFLGLLDEILDEKENKEDYVAFKQNETIYLNCNLDLEEGESTNEECKIWKPFDKGTYIQFICTTHNRMKNCLGDEAVAYIPNTDETVIEQFQHLFRFGYRVVDKRTRDFTHGTRRV